eukprot:TCALIF_08656-PA protein Name:"Protein of unknown function" AED:0.04 eAED:0.04 QI:77/0.66/1/1/0.66/0.75/4/274/140
MFAQLRSRSHPPTFQLRSLGLFLGLGLLVQCCSAESEWAQERYVDYTGRFPSSQLEDQHQLADFSLPAQLIAKKSGMERACGSLLANHMQLLCSGKKKRSSEPSEAWDSGIMLSPTVFEDHSDAILPVICLKSDNQCQFV